jgi:V/A-type H+-transporting ATPase subunit E
MANENLTKAAGVEELIDRLKTDGVSKGKHEADAIVADAKRQALSTTDAARQEANQIIADAKAEAERLRQTSHQALQLAGRDALIRLRESFQLQFENRLQKLVGSTLRDPDTLRQLILEIAGKVRPQRAGETVELLVPRESAPAGDPLASYVAGLTREMLAEGVTFGVDDDFETGVRVRLVDHDLDVDLSDEALAHFLGRFLIPRFRDLMDFKS